MTQYVFTYAPSYTGSFLIDDLPIRDEPYCQEDLPDIIYDHLESVDKKEIKKIERYVLVSEELHLWLLCCEDGLISAQDGYAIEED